MSDRNTQPYAALMTPGRARLVFVSGPCPTGVTYSLQGKEHVAGRHGNADISLAEDVHASQRHAAFRYQDRQLVVADEGSANGVYVRIRGPHNLEHGDWFRVGDQYFVFEILNEQENYPVEDGTHYFISQQRHARFRVVQVLEGGKAGLTSSTSGDDLTFGGAGSNVAFSADAHLSAQHARIYVSGDRFVIEDAGSVNGTFVRIKGSVPLGHGDYLIVGSQVMRVEIA